MAKDLPFGAIPTLLETSADELSQQFELVAAPASKSSTRAKRKTEALVVEGDTVLTKEDQESLVEALTSNDLTRFYLSNEREAQQFYSRSLSLFEDGLAITDVKEELLLKKSSERVRFVRPLKLLQRQLHNILLFVARPHMSAQDTFSVPLDYLSWAVEHNRNDDSYLKESVEEMQQSLMQIHDGTRWFSTQILQDVLIDSGSKTLFYKIPPLLKKMYSAPERYYHVSMRMNARFRSKYAHSLYELIRENLWRRQTGDIPLEEFRERMCIEPSEYPEFKRLSARVITPALAELELVSDYCATPKYVTKGRKIVAINFHIWENTKNQLVFAEEGDLDPVRFTILRENMGIGGAQIRELTRNYKLKRLEEVVDVLYYRYVLQNRAIRKGLSLVTNALNDTEDKYFLTAAEKTELAAHRERQRTHALETEMSKLASEKRRTALDRFNDWWPSLSAEKQKEYWSLFLDDTASHAVVRTLKVPRDTPDTSHPLVLSTLLAFVARVGLIPD